MGAHSRDDPVAVGGDPARGHPCSVLGGLAVRRPGAAGPGSPRVPIDHSWSIASIAPAPAGCKAAFVPPARKSLPHGGPVAAGHRDAAGPGMITGEGVG